MRQKSFQISHPPAGPSHPTTFLHIPQPLPPVPARYPLLIYRRQLGDLAGLTRQLLSTYLLRLCQPVVLCFAIALNEAGRCLDKEEQVKGATQIGKGEGDVVHLNTVIN